MRRGVGVAAVHRRQAEAKAASELGQTLAANRASHVALQLEIFRKHLESFAAKYRTEINADPEFRRAFSRMAASIGVDPLASAKGFWGELLGLGDFYFELGVQIVDVCISTRAANGGLIALHELRERLQVLRGRHGQRIGDDDVLTALRKLSCLGNGYRIITVGREQFILSVPAELSLDDTIVLQTAASASPSTPKSTHPPGAISVRELVSRLGWTPARATAACNRLTRDEMAWIDTQGPGGPSETLYWFPSQYVSSS